VSATYVLSRTETRGSIVQYLSQHWMFGVLDEDVLRQLASDVIVRVYPKHNRLYYKGELTTHMYIIRNGLVVNAVEREDGKIFVRQVCYPGDVLSSSTAVLNRPHVGTALVLMDSVVLLIPRETIDSLWRRFAEVAYQILYDMYCKLRMSEQREVSAHAKGIIARMAELILSIASKCNPVNDGQKIAEITLTQEDLALILGSSRETVSRVLSHLARMGVITTGRRRVTIVDPIFLAELARGKPGVE
jgi:CRP/FNR family cyclic AMP-dependent transcriptional regulator